MGFVWPGNHYSPPTVSPSNSTNARFFEKGRAVVLADCSTGEAEEPKAFVVAGKMLAQLLLEKLARAKAAQSQDGSEDAEKPLSNYYVLANPDTLPSTPRPTSLLKMFIFLPLKDGVSMKIAY